MCPLIQILFNSFWSFVGCLLMTYLVLYMVLKTIAHIWTRFLRMLMVRKQGWPPSHLDADGDFKQQKQ